MKVPKLLQTYSKKVHPKNHMKVSIYTLRYLTLVYMGKCTLKLTFTLHLKSYYTLALHTLPYNR